MQLKITTNYAIRIILELARHKKRTSIELADLLSVEVAFILKILNKLKHEDLLQVMHGVSGGYLLKKNPKDLTMLDIIKVMEPTIKINRCLEDDIHVKHTFATYSLKSVYLQVQERIEGEFSNTIAELVEVMNIEKV